MQVILEIPDEISAELHRKLADPARAALEALAVEGYRGRTFTTRQVRLLLGHASR